MWQMRCRYINSSGVSQGSNGKSVDLATIPLIIAQLHDCRRIEEQESALSQLAAIVDLHVGQSAAELGGKIREYGGIEVLLKILHRPSTSQAQYSHAAAQDALFVISSLASDTFEKDAKETKKLIHEMGGFQQLLRMIRCADCPNRSPKHKV